MSIASLPVEVSISRKERRWRAETRSAWLRFVAFIILVLLITAAKHLQDPFTHSYLIAAYGLATVAALALVIVRRGANALGTFFVALDAIMVVILFREHLHASGDGIDSTLTAPALAVSFLILTQVALRLRPQLVLLFSSIVTAGWLSLIALAAIDYRPVDWPALLSEMMLVLTFMFASSVCYLITNDHTVLLTDAIASERRRRSLARFFSPNILSELQSSGTSLALSRRAVAVLFVDLRSFTKFSETVEPEEVAHLLGEYRELVTRTVFDHDGIIDKFIGDGVMVVFGQVKSASDDASRALRCALSLRDVLTEWTRQRRARKERALDAGIGLHVGVAVGGILQTQSHDEFTLFGDTINIAQRLERLTRTLNASLVVSESALASAEDAGGDTAWQWTEAVELAGRQGRMRVAYLPRAGT